MAGVRAISFNTHVNATRALIETTEDLQAITEGFGVYGSKDKNELFKNQKVTYQSGLEATNGTDWTYTPIKYWDQSETVVYDYCAYAPYKADGVTSADNKFTVTGIPQWQECQTDAGKAAAYDFLVADNRTGNFKKGDFTNGIVDFKFKHKLAKVIISITKENSTSLTDITYTVKGITLGGDGTQKVFGSGDGAITITADQNSKIPEEQNRTFVRDYLSADSKAEKFEAPAINSSAVTLYDNSEGQVVSIAPTYTTIATYLVAPFDLAEGKTIPITVNYVTSADQGTRTPVASTTTLNGFKPGFVYNIKLKVGAVNVTAAVIEIQQWTEGGSADDDVYNW